MTRLSLNMTSWVKLAWEQSEFVLLATSKRPSSKMKSREISHPAHKTFLIGGLYRCCQVIQAPVLCMSSFYAKLRFIFTVVFHRMDSSVKGSSLVGLKFFISQPKTVSKGSGRVWEFSRNGCEFPPSEGKLQNSIETTGWWIYLTYWSVWNILTFSSLTVLF